MTSLIPPFLRRWLQSRREVKERRAIAEVKRRLREWANEVESEPLPHPAAPGLDDWSLTDADVQVIRQSESIAPEGFILPEADVSVLRRKFQ